MAKHAAVSRAWAALDVAAAPPADVSAEEARVKADPDDHEARFAIANAFMAAGDRDGAAEALLEIIGRDKECSNGAARSRFLQLLEAAGFEDSDAGAAAPAVGGAVHVMDARPARVPLFPRPGRSCSRAQLPLHIFEDRYRAMVEDAPAGAGASP